MRGDATRTLCGIALVLTCPALPVCAQAPDPADAVFQLINVDTSTNQKFRYGSAFFIAPDGTAVTNSYIVAPLVEDPDRYRLLAIVGREFYAADVVWASKLSYDAVKMLTAADKSVVFSRDVAENGWYLRSSRYLQLWRCVERLDPCGFEGGGDT